ncbi:hypothetical protein [Streptomyces sp. NPDC058466]|uniref:hypothetical protein n=1 Tax=Streptomyces sp. NPDC058466 TaxID=3346512 RepID=UPI003666740E
MRHELEKAVEDAIGALDQAYRRIAKPSDLYEAALFAVAVQASKDAGGHCLITNDGTSTAGRLRFRCSPGNLWSGNFTYALVSFTSGKKLEIHLGVYVLAGRVAHECEVAILDHAEAERSRAGGVHPRRGRNQLISCVEAKLYAASPPLGVGRGFLGLATELGRGKCSLAFPAKASDNIAALIAGKPSEHFDELVPGGSKVEGRFSHFLETAIRNWLAM